MTARTKFLLAEFFGLNRLAEHRADRRWERFVRNHMSMSVDWSGKNSASRNRGGR